jgi:hypothetical protein
MNSFVFLDEVLLFENGYHIEIVYVFSCICLDFSNKDFLDQQNKVRN